MKSSFHSKLSPAKRPKKRGRLSWWGINRHIRKKKLTMHLTIQITIQHCSSAKLLLHLSRALFTRKKEKKMLLRVELKNKKKAHNRRNNDQASTCVNAKKNCTCKRERAAERMWVVFESYSHSNERRALVHPYVFKIAKFSSIRQTMPKFFREFVMGAS